MFFHIHKIFLAFFFGIIYNGYMEKTIRQPQQERSNEKKQKIIDASYELFAEIGYYSANTQEIAKRAGVSTGIVYSYFKDKRDILLHVLKIYIDKVTEPFGRIIDGIKLPLDIDALIVEFIDVTIKTHKENAHLHNTLHSLEVSDEDVKNEFMALQDVITEKIYAKLGELGFEKKGLKEGVHLAMNSIQSFAHEYVYDTHDYLDYSVMKEKVCEMIRTLFV